MPRFGQTENFIIFDPITKGWDVFPNPALNARGNIGVQVTEFIANHDVQVAVSADFGFNAAYVLARVGIHIFSVTNTLRIVLADYEGGQLREVIPSSGTEFQPREVLPDPAQEGY